METKKIYLKDRNLSELQTTVLTADIYEKDNNDAILTFSETVFFPGGGGQSCDTGKITFKTDPNSNGNKSDAITLDIVETFEHGGIVYHHAKDGAKYIEASTIAPGTECEIELDWDRRFDNMQRHCGEHILSGVFYDLYGGVNRGFHMGDEYMTIDISLEDKDEFVGKEVTWDMALAAELRTNEIIWSNLPVIPHHFDTREEAEKMPLRKKLAIESDITIVTIGDASNPADSVACCGTHPTTTGQVGMLKIYKVEPNKGMYRIFFDAGKRALMGYRERFEILGRLEKDLSAGVPDLIDKYYAKQEKQKEIRDRLYHLTKDVQKKEVQRIKDAKASNADSDGSFLFEYSVLTIDDVIDIGRELEGELPYMLFLLHEPSNTLLLFSDIHDCGKMVKDNASVFNGKGGGNQKFARAIFTRRDDLDMFIAAVRNLIR